MAEFEHLNAPYSFKRFYSTYPEGYSIYEALLDWVNQVNEMTTVLNLTLSEWENFKLWVNSELKTYSDEKLIEWLNDGTLETLINQILFDTKADKTTTDNLQNQLNEIETQPFITNKMMKNTTDIGIYQINKNLGKIDQSYLSDELLAQMAGTTPINNVVGDQTITPIKTTFLNIGKNKFNKATVKTGFYVNQEDGILTANPAHSASDYIPIKPNTYYIGSPTMQRYCFYDTDKNYISGGLGSQGTGYLSPINARYLVFSNENMDPNVVMIEEGQVMTDYVPYGYRLDSSFLIESQPSESFIGDINKKYRLIGANIRTPLYENDTFKIHNDPNHESSGIHEVSIYQGELRIIMSFTAKKVVTVSVQPHVSLLQEGYTCATTGGLNVHAIVFFKNGVKVNAEDVIVNGGSLWLNGTFLID